jgi:CRP-like cAMP-binding protein
MELAQADLEAVRRHFLFAGLDDRRFGALRAGLGACALEADQTLFHAGDPAHSFYLVAEGQIELFLLAKSGEKKVVEVIEPGRSFAEAVAFMSAQRYPVNARALAPARLYRVTSRVYIDILREDPDACLRLVGDLCRRLHGRLVEIQELTIENATHRLVRYLLAQAGERSGDSAAFELRLARQVIASRLAMQPETLSRLLKGLVEAGVLEVDGRTVRIPSRAALEAYE